MRFGAFLPPRKTKRCPCTHKAHEASGYLCGHHSIRPIEHQIIIATKVAVLAAQGLVVVVVPSVLLHIINDGQIGRTSTVLRICAVSKMGTQLTGTRWRHVRDAILDMTVIALVGQESDTDGSNTISTCFTLLGKQAAAS